MIKKTLSCLFILVASIACVEKQTNEGIEENSYYDLVGLLNQQIELLANQKATLEKTMGAGEEIETIRLTPDTTLWKEELKLFFNADINKLGLGDAYEVEQLSRLDGGRKLINAAKSEAQPVRLIEYNFSSENLESIRILVEEKNEVYVFKKEMHLSFTSDSDELIMTQYSIDGSQTMVMKSDLNFSLNGKVILNP